MRHWLPAAMVFMALASCVNLSRNILWDPPQDDESMVVLFVGMKDGWMMDLTLQPLLLAFAQISPEIIGPLPAEREKVNINGVDGFLYYAGNLPTPGIYKIGEVLTGKQVSRALMSYIVHPVSRVGINDGPVANASRPGAYFMGSYLFVNEGNKLLEPLPTITEKQVLEKFLEVIGSSKPGWASKIHARLLEAK